MISPGKRFEQDFSRSIPSDVYQFRLRDCGGWGESTATRFTPSNPYDYLMFAGGWLYLLEMKTTKQPSLRFDAVRPNQEKGLHDAVRFERVHAGVVVNFREHETTLYLSIQDFVKLKKKSKKKSFNIEDALLAGARVIDCTYQKGRRPVYDVQLFINNMTEDYS